MMADHPKPVDHPDIDHEGGWPDMEEQICGEALRPERDYGPEPSTHCSMCGKPLEATLTCHACGDRDFRVRPDVNVALGRVFDGDTGERRREQDAA